MNLKEVIYLDSIASRIIKIAEDNHLNKSEFARRINVTPAYISKLSKQPDSVPSDRTISDICRVFNINEEWLRTGTGSMYLSSNSFDLTQYALDRGCDALELEILKAYFSLPKDIRKAALEHFKKCLATPSPVPAPDQSVEELEEEYKKRHSVSASTTDSTASSSTDAEKAAGD